MNTPDVIFLGGKKESVRWTKYGAANNDHDAQIALLRRVIQQSVGDLKLYNGRITPFNVEDICALVVDDIQLLLQRYGECMFSVSSNGEPPETLPSSISIGGGHITTRHKDHYDNEYTRDPAGIIYDMCDLRMSKDLDGFSLKDITRLSWNISTGVTLFVRENLFSLFGPIEHQSSNTQTIIPRSVQALVLLTNMVLSNASKEEVDRAANYAVSVIAAERSATDCAVAEKTNGIDELMKKYYPT